MTHRIFIFLLIGLVCYTASMITAAHYYSEKKYVQGYLSGSQSALFEQPVKMYISERMEFCMDDRGNPYRAKKRGSRFEILR